MTEKHEKLCFKIIFFLFVFCDVAVSHFTNSSDSENNGSCFSQADTHTVTLVKLNPQENYKQKLIVKKYIFIVCSTKYVFVSQLLLANMKHVCLL